MQGNGLGLTEKSLRMYLAAALVFMVVAVIELVVYVTDSFGNSVRMLHLVSGCQVVSVS